MFEATSLILALSLLAGQLIKIPVSGLAGLTILDIATFLLCLWGSIQLRFKFTKFPKYLIPALLFILVGFLSLLINPLHLNPKDILTSSFYGLRFIMYLFLGFLVYTGALSKIRKNLIDIFLLSGIGLAVLGLIQLIFLPNLSFLTAIGWDPHYFRVVSTFLDPNFLGVFLTLTLLLLTLVIFNKKQTISPTILKITFVITFLALLATFSRSAALMCGVSFLTLSAVKKSKQIFLLTIALGICFGITFLIYRSFISQPRNIDRTQSAEFRLSDWQQGVKIFQYSPFIGVGFNSYKYALQNLHLASDAYTQTRGATSNDSSLLFVTSTTGILGLLIYLSFLGLLFKRSFFENSKGNIWGSLMFSGLAGLIVSSFFIDSLFYPFILCWIFLVSSQLFPSKAPDKT